MALVKIDADSFDIGKLNAIEQFHVFLKIAPVLASFIKLRLSTQRKLEEGEGAEEKRKVEIGTHVESFAMALSKLPKEDVDFILEACLSVCKKQIGAGWHPVWLKGAGLTDQTMPLMTMLRLIWSALEENLTSFFDSAVLILTKFTKTAK